MSGQKYGTERSERYPMGMSANSVPEHDLLTVEEAAKVLRAGESTVRRWIAEGRLAAVSVGKKLLIGRAAILAMVEVANTAPLGDMRSAAAHTMSVGAVLDRQKGSMR